MRTWRALLIGFGNVGQGLAERLVAAEAELRAAGVDVRIVGVVDPVLGSVGSDAGLDPARLLEAVGARGALRDLDGAQSLPDDPAVAAELGADIVFEMTPTNLQHGEPGLRHVRDALSAGRHVVTTNKGPVALAWPELKRLADQHGVQLRCEGTVLSGTPLLNLVETGLAGAGVTGVRGILNGTCNFILSRMEEDVEYEGALEEAQRLGYAETDPAGDVEGWDAAAKVTILGNLVLGGELTLADVVREGVDGVGLGDVHAAQQAGNRLRLVGSVRREADGTVGEARVEIAELSADDPLANVRGAGNLLTFDTDALGPVSIGGPGAGRAATGHALIADLIAVHRRARS